MMDLQIFCGTVCRDDLAEPFGDGVYTYATNGYIVVRVAFVDGTKKEFPLRMEEAIRDVKFNPDHEGKWVSIPPYESPEKKTCHHCSGTRKSMGCEDCDGEGHIMFNHGRYVYECECKRCRGEGMVPGGENTCTTCDGSGELYADPYAGVKIGNVKLAIKLLDKIKSLPGAELYLPAPESGMVNFRFDGGVGLAMKMIER